MYENFDCNHNISSSTKPFQEMYEITDEYTDDSWTYDIGNFDPYKVEVTPLTVGIYLPGLKRVLS